MSDSEDMTEFASIVERIERGEVSLVWRAGDLWSWHIRYVGFNALEAPLTSCRFDRGLETAVYAYSVIILYLLLYSIIVIPNIKSTSDILSISRLLQTISFVLAYLQNKYGECSYL